MTLVKSDEAYAERAKLRELMEKYPDVVEDFVKRKAKATHDQAKSLIRQADEPICVGKLNAPMERTD